MNNLIGMYVNKMTLKDIDNFFRNNNVILSEKEMMFIYDFVKRNWQELLGSYKSFDLKRYKSYFSAENYPKLEALLEVYRKKYATYF